jgi:hypothetical protein
MWEIIGPPRWSSGQSSWLQIRRPGFDSRHYQKKKVVGLGLSLVTTTEELECGCKDNVDLSGMKHEMD